jgi:hypothetical protein
VLESGILRLLVNTIDVAGVEIPAINRTLNIVVNYDPDTRILKGESFEGVTYPYYWLPPNPTRYTFSNGDTIPDRAWVVVMAEGHDDHRDGLFALDTDTSLYENHMMFQGNFSAVGRYEGTAPFYFATSYSRLNQADNPDWTAPTQYETSRDTLSFEVGPFDYTVRMRAVDNLGRRDGTPDSLRFHGNFPPCVQCVEMMNLSGTPTYTLQSSCMDETCLEETTVLHVRRTDGVPDSQTLTRIPSFAIVDTIWFDAEAGNIKFRRPADASSYKYVLGRHYGLMAYLHGKEINALEQQFPVGQKHRRIAAWYYQVDYQGDHDNVIKDGGGIDYIRSMSGFTITNNDSTRDLFVVADESKNYVGAWGVRITVGVPDGLRVLGTQGYWGQLLTLYLAPPRPAEEAAICAWQQDARVQLAYRAWQLTTMQFTPGTMQALASDVSRCEWRGETMLYHYYEGVRPPHLAHGRKCQEGFYDEQGENGVQEADVLELASFPTVSNGGVPFAKHFRIEVEMPDNSWFSGGVEPPNWLSCGKRARSAWH